MQKLLIDTDPGQDIDDLLALHFALRRPELDIRAITTVTWPSDRRARLVKRLLRYLGRRDIPVAAGLQHPFRPMNPQQRQAQRDDAVAMNHAAFAEPPEAADDPDANDAPGLIIRTVRSAPGEVALACIAPLTNIAAALCRDPDIAAQIPYIALMGGETAENRAEHNIAFDPVAADLVLRSGIPIFMGTWGVTRQFAMSMDECRAFHEHAAPVCQALGRAIDLWHPAQNWKAGPVMYDLFPMIHAFDESIYTLETQSVAVELQGAFSRGMTVRTAAGTDVNVTVAMDVQRAREMYLATIFS